MAASASDDPRWMNVYRYLEAGFAPPGGRAGALAAALAASEAAGLPAIQVSATQGKLLEVLVRMTRAQRVLEIGTLGGYSAIWIAGALPPGGSLITLELEPHHAEVARANVARAGLAGVVDIRVGPALESLAQLVAAGGAPFDLVFIDADKQNNAAYLARALELTAPGSTIIVDNVVRGGQIADPAASEARVIGARRCLDQMASDPRLCATALQTVGAKGYDGFAIAYRVA
jgi:predicted O-methyltransferase YrrM